MRYIYIYMLSHDGLRRSLRERERERELWEKKGIGRTAHERVGERKRKKD